jgi:basic membrane protein A
VFAAIKDSFEGNFDNTPYVGTLKNLGVSISPFHEFESTIPADLKTEIEALKAQIIGGDIKVESAGAN